MSTEEVIAEILKNNNIDVKDLEGLIKQKKEAQEPKKIRLAPLSFSKVSNFFVKVREQMTSRKIEAKRAELNELQEKASDESYELTEYDAIKLARKMAKLKDQISVLEGEKRVHENEKGTSRALKIRGDMFKCIRDQSVKFYKFIKNSFDRKTEKDSTQQGASSMEEQLSKKLGSMQKDEPPVSLNDLENNGEYHLKRNEIIQDDPIIPTPIIQDPPFESREVPSLPSMSASVALPPNGYHDAIIKKAEGLNETPNNQKTSDSKKIEEIRKLEKERDILQAEVNSRKGYSGDDYIRKQAQGDLDKVMALLEGLLTSAPNNVGLSDDSSIESLRDLMRKAEEEDRKAQAIADQARLAKEEALQAAKEKEENERLSAQTNERYEQLLREAKEAIEIRSQEARAKQAREQAELDRNRALITGIRRDSESIQAKVAARQNEISQLKTVLGQYRTDPPPVSKK